MHCTEYFSSCMDNIPKNAKSINNERLQCRYFKNNSLSLLGNEFCRLIVLNQYITEPTRVTNISSCYSC